MAATPDGKGYWLVTSAGGVYAYGDASRVRPPRARSVKGIVAAPGGGYWLYTATGNVYPIRGRGLARLAFGQSLPRHLDRRHGRHA